MLHACYNDGVFVTTIVKQMRWHKEGNMIVKTMILCCILRMARLGRLYIVLI
jgi:hypothetical protein